MEQSGMAETPPGWCWATIDKLVGPDGVFKDGDWVESKDQDPNGSVRLIQLADIGDGDFRDKSARFLTREKASELNCTFLAQGDLLVARMPDPLGRACLFPLSGTERFVTVVDVCVVRLDQSHIDSKYFMYALNSPQSRKQISGHQTGSTRKRISRGNLSTVPFPIAPLHEQHRIVAKIEELFSELDKGVENLKTAQAQLKVYRQALLKHAFEGKLTAQWRADNPDKLETADALLKRIQKEREQRYRQQVSEWEAGGKQGSKPKAPEPLPPLVAEETSCLPVVPDGWVYVRAEEIAGFITKGTTPSKELLFSASGDIPFIKVYNLTKTGFLDFSIDPTFVSKETHNKFLARSKVYPGDVLMNIVGPPLGKVSIVPNTYPEWNINQAIAIFRTQVISNKFLSAYLAHETTVRTMMRKSKATAGQFNLTLEICRQTIIPFCCKDEQNEIELLIEEKLSEVDQLDQTISTALQQSEALRQSILKKAFSGQLVPQDPTDEPASALLARIKAEQSAAPKAKKARK
jgi:type I restriction enzyme S subunit